MSKVNNKATKITSLSLHQCCGKVISPLRAEYNAIDLKAFFSRLASMLNPDIIWLLSTLQKKFK